VASLYESLTTIQSVEGLAKEPAVRESDSLEYKEIRNLDKDRDGIAIALTAFANANGGVLVVGMATGDKQDQGKPTELRPLSRKQVDWLEMNVESQIRHPIPRGAMRAKVLGDSDRLVLVYEVEPSPLAPHQFVPDARYYRREGPKSVPMSHDLVELFFGRRSGPLLRPRGDTVEMVPGGNEFRVRFTIHNAGAGVATDVLARLVRSYSVVRLVDGQWTGETQTKAGLINLWYSRDAKIIYPDLPVPAGALVFPRGHGKSQPLGFLDVYAKEMRPRRYRLFHDGTALSAETPNGTLECEEEGIPPILTL
jgi:hypothetical protein